MYWLLGNCRLALERRRLFARGRRAPELLSVDSAKLGQQINSWGITALDAGPRASVIYRVTCVIVCLGVSSIAKTSDEIGTEIATAFQHKRDDDLVCTASCCQCCFAGIFGQATC